MTNQQEAAAIALCGAHPILLVGGETSRPATELADAMGKALPRLAGKRCAETEAIWKRGGVRRGKKYRHEPPVVTTTADDPVLQEPTHPIGCAELAHNGVLAAEDIHAWSERRVAQLYIAAVQGHARKRDGEPGELPCHCRVTASVTGCGCPNRAEYCQCGPKEIEAAAKHLWGGTCYFFFDIAAPGPAQNDRIDVKELAKAFRRARTFAISTRNQTEPNARTQPESGATGWILTNGAQQALHELAGSSQRRSRTLQLARSAADLDESKRIAERHLSIAADLNQTPAQSSRTLGHRVRKGTNMEKGWLIPITNPPTWRTDRPNLPRLRTGRPVRAGNYEGRRRRPPGADTPLATRRNRRLRASAARQPRLKKTLDANAGAAGTTTATRTVSERATRQTK